MNVGCRIIVLRSCNPRFYLQSLRTANSLEDHLSRLFVCLTSEGPLSCSDLRFRADHPGSAWIPNANSGTGISDRVQLLAETT